MTQQPRLLCGNRFNKKQKNKHPAMMKLLLILELFVAACAHPARLGYFYFKFDAVPVKKGSCVEDRRGMGSDIVPEENFNFALAYCGSHRRRELTLVLNTKY